MIFARLHFGNEKLVFGQNDRDNHYYLSLTREIPEGKEYVFYEVHVDFNKLRMMFEDKAKQMMDMRTNLELQTKV